MDSSQFAVPLLPGNYANHQIASAPSNSAGLPSTSATNFAIPNSSTAMSAASVIRRRRFSTAKIQPTRIKKVMQSDEEIGRMVQSVPVSIGRAMEHFAEKFLQAASDVSQFSSSKTLTPQHMKQAMLSNPHFRFLEPILKDIILPQQISEMALSRNALTLKDQQNMKEQQSAELANAILANAQLQMQNLQQEQKDVPHLQPQYMVPSQDNENPVLQASLVNSIAAFAAELPTTPLTPNTPTTDLMNVMKMLKCASQEINNQEQQKVNGTKRLSVEGNGNGSFDDDKPRRGRPKKKKTEKCIDDALFEEASKNIAKEDKDRELMPPPTLPIGDFPRP